ncbi:hypothetical protein LSAT2_001974 [Lamellibrachia satsuma]|nr:hypothetical protein LSAT2_001974 [Lamellibrachia satsuma]
MYGLARHRQSQRRTHARLSSRHQRQLFDNDLQRRRFARSVETPDLCVAWHERATSVANAGSSSVSYIIIKSSFQRKSPTASHIVPPRDSSTEMSRRKQAKPRSLIVTPEDEINTEEVATDHPTQSPEDLLPPCQVISNRAQQECDSLKLEPASTETEPVDHCSDVNVVSSDHPLGGAQLPGGVFHCEVCSREFDSLSRFMDHRNEGCVSSENVGIVPALSARLNAALVADTSFAKVK